MTGPDLTRRGILAGALGGTAALASGGALLVRERSGGGPAPGASAPAAAGAPLGRNWAGVNLGTVNIAPFRTYTNLLAYNPWQALEGSGLLSAPAHVDASGQVIGFPPGTTGASAALGPPGHSRSARYRIECTGHPIDGFYWATPKPDDVTTGTDTSVSPAIHWCEFTMAIDMTKPLNMPRVMIKSPDVRDLFCAEVTGRTPSHGRRTPYVETGLWHSSFLSALDSFGEIRPMDWTAVNADCGKDWANPVTVSNHARRLHGYPPNSRSGFFTGVGADFNDNACRLVAGGLTLYPNTDITSANIEGAKQIGRERLAAIRTNPASVTMQPGVIEYMPLGASANGMALVVHEPAAAGAVSFNSLTATISVTPVTGQTSGSAILAQLAGAGDRRIKPMIDFDHSKATAEPVPPGTYRFAGGVYGQRQGDVAIEDVVDLCIARKLNLHWNLPVAVADDYLRHCGEHLARLIPHGLRADVEVGNEIWNMAFVGQWTQLLLSAHVRGTYGIPEETNLFGVGLEFVIARTIELTGHAKAIIAPYFRSAPNRFRTVLNVQQGSVDAVLARTLELTPALAAGYAAAIDVNTTAFYIDGDWQAPTHLDPAQNWAANTAYPADAVVEVNNVAYFARNAVNGATPPAGDPSNWGVLAADDAALARILKKNVDVAMPLRVSDAQRSARMGKAYKVYEGAFGFKTGDAALLAKMTAGPAVADATAYLRREFLRQIGPQATFDWYCIAYGDDRGWSLGHTNENFPNAKANAFAGVSA